MSITGSFSSALSGLTASSRAAEIVSSNIANAMTPGYGRREIQLASRVVGSGGQGVTVTGVVRNSDPVVIGERRLAQAGSGGLATNLDFLKQVEVALGTPDTPTSLGSRISDFDSALIEAASGPESETNLTRVIQTAKALAGHISDAGTAIQHSRETADHQIAGQVDQVNSALARIAELNGQIQGNSGVGRDASALMDQRQQLIDSVAAIVPLREVPRENGQLALYTSGGAILLEGAPAKLGFEPASIIVPGMTQSGGALSGLTLNGKPISTAADGGPISGGTLSAAFAFRDDIAPQAQAQLDALARDLTDRFADPALDASQSPGAAGLFTDAGAALLPGNEAGLAQRLQINAAADPAQGGALWRLRDGLGAVTPGAIGNGQLLKDMQTALATPRAAGSTLLPPGARSFATFSAGVVSSVASARVTAESESSFASARLDSLSQMEQQGGVDTDQEMQSLLLIERAYSANAKVISAVGDMIKTLLDI